MTAYIPEIGDIIWLDFDPTIGKEQAGHRPALVLSPQSYNKKVGLLLCCPLTSKVKGYPFEVLISGTSSSVALADQVNSLDWQSRRATFKGKASEDEINQVRAKISALLQL
ncbi:endoribonuclease MazF [Pelistega suis]|uniref:endoribonuclease MazF n=1 Tax=Pelistega suis TaxID=1631957 RepID=UPI00211BD4D7|nr:endoribonuclease MazF [Pelistega suis]MCQ9329078.1 endoribonuclease MazF [Pelistega suis]